MKQQHEPRYFDKRTAKRNIKRGFLKEDEYEKFLKSLPDEAENSVPVSYEELDAAELSRLSEMNDEEPTDDDSEPETSSEDE